MDHGSDLLFLTKMERVTPHQWKYLEQKYLHKTRKCIPEKFEEVCMMHLSFLLDLSDDKLEHLISHSDEKKKKSGFASLKKKLVDRAVTGLFGAPLNNEGVSYMKVLIQFLLKESNVCKEGIFRKPGNHTRMNTLRETLLLKGTSTIIDPEIYTAYDVACVLKEFLRELPEPLFTYRFLDAHSQILSLGRHATTPEEIERYQYKKLSAFQLLMLVMPTATQKMIKSLIRLLKKVSSYPETKMTPVTLGTIFAPIFFLHREIDASEVCSAVSQTEPSVAFMIQNADELFHAPKELIIDLAHYWNRLGSDTTDTEDDNEGTGQPQLRKCLSGRTLDTNVCYLDREMSRCDDVASNTQRELQNLYAHVQSLPDTPTNKKLKSRILKSTTTPTKKEQKRGKSIGASIKKRLPSIGRSKGRNSESSHSSASSATSRSSCEELTVANSAVLSDLLMSPTSSKTSTEKRASRPKHKRINVVHPMSECSPIKQECLADRLCISPQKENIPQIFSSPKITLAATRSTIPSTPNENSSVNRKTSPRLKPLPLSLAQNFSPKYVFAHSENEINYLPNYPVISAKNPLTPSNGQQRPRELKSCRGPGTPIMPRCFLQMAQSNATLETSI